MAYTRELRSRPPVERMIQIHDELAAKRFPNCTRLMEITGVGRRTILRDIDFMKERMNLPIDYYHPEFGYRYTKPVDRFPLPTVTEREVFALFVAHSVVNSYRGTPFEPLLRGAFKKLAGQLDDETHISLGDMQQELSFRPFAPDEVNLDTFEKLSRSVRHHKVVRFSYKALGKAKAQTRDVHPHHLACVDNRWYAISFDPNRNDFRKFVLTRMADVVVLERTFQRQKGFSPEKYTEGGLIIFGGTDDKPIRVVAEFRDWAADLVKERRWHPTQAIEDLDGGGVRLSMTLTNLVEVERWLLGWGDHVTVLEPQSLRDRMARISRAMLERHSQADRVVDSPPRKSPRRGAPTPHGAKPT